jgi:hypothetical protein
MSQGHFKRPVGSASKPEEVARLRTIKAARRIWRHGRSLRARNTRRKF